MSTFMDAVRSNRRMLWLDATDYSARLLMRDVSPWLDAAGYVAWQRKTHALLGSDVIAVPVARLAGAWVGTDDALRLAMRTRHRSTYPLQVLLGDAGLREYLSGLMRDLRTTFADRVLALTLPAPRRFLCLAYALARGDAASLDIEEDDADTAAVYVADFLRTFAGAGIDVVLLEETSAVPTQLGDASYEPLVNLARHYRWDIGVRAQAVESTIHDVGLDFTVTTAPPTCLAAGIEVDVGFWSGAAGPSMPDGGFLFAEIPADAAPEQVLERLAVLRAR